MAAGRQDPIAHPTPLTSLQSAIASLIAHNRTSSSHLAGAAAPHLESRCPRASNALDHFHDREALVGGAFAADRMALELGGYEVNVVLSQPGFVRAIVGRGGEATKVEWAHNSAWRFPPPVPDPVVGFRLHPIDLSINKVLALAGRDEPLDFLDILFVHRNYPSLGSLCWAAERKDLGYGPQMLAELLARKGRFRPEDFADLALAAPPKVPELKLVWLDALADAAACARTPGGRCRLPLLESPGTQLRRSLRRSFQPGPAFRLSGRRPPIHRRHSGKQG